jgi:hypothetical protein
MARKKEKAVEGFVMFDVIYEDGTRSSRRKISANDVAVLGDAHARTAIMDQDREIAARSGNSRGPIRSISRSNS